MTESPLRCDRPTCRPTETRSLDSRQERRKPRALTTALSTSCMTPRCGKWYAPPLTAYEPQGASGACRDFPISDGVLMGNSGLSGMTSSLEVDGLLGCHCVPEPDPSPSTDRAPDF